MHEILDSSESESPKKKLYTGKYAGIAEKLRVAEQQMKYARITLYVLAGLIVLLIAFVYAVTFFSPGFSIALSPITVLLIIFLAIIFFVCGWLSQKHPVIAFAVAFGIYFLLQLGGVILDPSSWSNGIVIKLVILSFLGIGLFSSLKVKNYRNILAIADAEMLEEEN